MDRLIDVVVHNGHLIEVYEDDRKITTTNERTKKVVTKSQ
jgi:hypothetical protein